MKFFSVSFRLILLGSVVISITPIEDVEQKLGEIMCGVEIMGKLLENTEFKNEYVTFLKNVRQWVKVDSLNCHEKKEDEDVLKCLWDVHLKVAVEQINFVGPIYEKDEKLFDEISKVVEAKCYNSHVLFDGTDDLPQKFQCYAKIMGEVSEANGMSKMWAQTQPKLQEQINNRKNCVDFARCRYAEMMIINILSDYMQLMGTKNPQILENYLHNIQEKCGF